MLYGATLFVPLAIGTPEDLAELKKDNVDLKQQIEDIKAKSPNIQEPVQQ
jgi:hypothetical protein